MDVIVHRHPGDIEAIGKAIEVPRIDFGDEGLDAVELTEYFAATPLGDAIVVRHGDGAAMLDDDADRLGIAPFGPLSHRAIHLASLGVGVTPDDESRDADE